MKFNKTKHVFYKIHIIYQKLNRLKILAAHFCVKVLLNILFLRSTKFKELRFSCHIR